MEGPLVEYSFTLPGYFRAMGIPLRSGRVFTEKDVAEEPATVIVNAAPARRFFPNQNPVGKHISTEKHPPKWLEIVGVVGDTRQWSLTTPAIPEMYQPTYGGRVILVGQGAIDPTKLAEPVRRELSALDKDLPLYGVQTMDDLLSGSSAWTRSRTVLLGLFAAVAPALAAIGIFGLISFSLSRRRHEIGIRIALGATRADVIRMTLGESLKLIAVGLVPGVVCAYGVTRYLSSLLFGVQALDPLTFAAVPLFLAAVTPAASWIPALRATAGDPAAALHHDEDSSPDISWYGIWYGDRQDHRHASGQSDRGDSRSDRGRQGGEHLRLREACCGSRPQGRGGMERDARRRPTADRRSANRPGTRVGGWASDSTNTQEP